MLIIRRLESQLIINRFENPIYPVLTTLHPRNKTFLLLNAEIHALLQLVFLSDSTKIALSRSCAFARIEGV